MSNTKALSFESEYHKFLYVGIDVHKDTHTAVATNCFGQHLLELKIANSEKDFDHLVDTMRLTPNFRPRLGETKVDI